VEEYSSPIQGTLLIGHTHWDHIQGFPFFAPLFIPGNQWNVYGPGGLGQQLKRGLAGQMTYEHFPVSLQELPARVRFQHLTEGVFEVGSVRVTTQYLNHPVFTLGYRLEADGTTLVYATDFEPFSLHPRTAPPGTKPLHPEDQRHIRFLTGADVIIHDAQYTLDDFPAKIGWGHMPIERAVDYALQAQARHLVLFHHDPSRHDAAVDQLLAQAQTRAASGGGGLHITAAAEGEGIELSPGAIPLHPIMQSPDVSALQAQPAPRPCTVLFAASDPAIVRLLRPALRAEGLRLLTTSDGEASVLRLAHQEELALILLDMALPGYDGLTLCRQLRAAAKPWLRDVPIVLLTEEKRSEQDLIAAFAAGATDYLAGPIKPTLIRSRIRAWLLRTMVESRSDGVVGKLM
jgi:CheY-like chemotaxis protein/phosphoribosyl 1,2-cyclic phosphodiesterase